MRVRLKPLILGAAVLVAFVAGAAFTAIDVRSRRTFDAPYPSITASSDPQTIEQGRYIVFASAGCAYCHVPREQWNVLDRREMPLSGNHVFRLPFGELYAPNLTPDPETGIGRRTDGELARILRYGVRADGRAAFPFMAYHDMSDEDLTAVVSFLRTQPPVRLAVPDHRLTRFGKTRMAFAIEPAGPSTTTPAASPRGPSIERGEYLATRISSCAECHTNRDPRSGQLVGPRFGGGQQMDLADPTKIAAEPHAASDDLDWRVERGRVRRALQDRRDDSRHADAVGRLRPHDRRRSAKPLSLSSDAAAVRERDRSRHPGPGVNEKPGRHGQSRGIAHAAIATMPGTAIVKRGGDPTPGRGPPEGGHYKHV